MTKAPVLAFGAAFLWGILSVLLSPCHLSSIPLIMGIISAEKNSGKKKAFWTALVFAIGMLVTIALIGIVTALAGKMLGNIGGWATLLAVVVLIFSGLMLLDVINLPSILSPDKKSAKKAEPFAIFILGLIFGLALGPCSFAFMAPVLGAVLNLSGIMFLYGILIILFYALGHCSVIVLAGTFTAVVRDYLNWNNKTSAITIIRKVCGGLVILGALYLGYDRLIGHLI